MEMDKCFPPILAEFRIWLELFQILSTLRVSSSFDESYATSWVCIASMQRYVGGGTFPKYTKQNSLVTYVKKFTCVSHTIWQVILYHIAQLHVLCRLCNTSGSTSWNREIYLNIGGIFTFPFLTHSMMLAFFLL